MGSQDIYQKQVELSLTNLGKKPQNILVFYGRSGIGKKDLCDSIFESWKSQCLCALLDGEEIGENFWNALKTAVIQLRKHFSPAKNNLTCFDLAYFSYMKRVESNLPANSAEFSKRMGYAEIGDNAAELINGFLEEFKKLPIPGIEPLAKLAWFCMLLSNPEHWEWYRRSKCRDRLQEMGNCTRNKEVLQQLPIFLLNDLHEYLQRSNLPASKRKAMILVDGYEYLLDKSLRCTWLEEMVTQRNPNVLWVIFSEQPLNLTQDTHNIPIIPLTDDECQAVLKEKFGIDDPQIRQIIIQASGGIPLYLQLGVETWQDIKKQRQPKVADFARNLNEVLRQRDAAWEPDERRMWQVLSNCRTWDKVLFVSLMEQFHLENWRDRFDKVLASPYVEQAGSGWRLHPIMRQHLQENQPEDLKQAVNSWLFEHYQREYQNPEIQLTALGEALHHGLESQQPQQAISWFLEQVAVQQKLGRHQAVAPMLQFLLKGEQNVHATTALAWSLLGKSLVAMGDYDRAVKDLEIARSQWIALQQGDSLDAATVELELAGVYLKLERTFDASNAVQKALRIRTTQLGANELAVAEVLNRQAEVAASQGDYREAANLSQRALQILQSDPSTQPLQLAQWKYTAAWLNAYNNNLDVAEKLCQEAMEIAKNVASDEHPLAISCQTFLGDIYQGMGQHKYQKAYEQYQLALDAAEISFGPSHPQTLQLLQALTHLCRKVGEYDTADEFAERHNAHVQIGNFEETAGAALRLNNLGISLLNKGQYGKAEPLLKQALQIYLRVLGAEHPDTARSLNNLAGLYDSQGRYDQAEPLYNQALQIRLKVLGAEHPDTKAVESNLILLRKQLLS
ncbi:tetratricopeptide repeat protein [Scytonema sp. UIC 10036]|uniref:tetratricopeptide repeat protein n=1 Tax=Scytonema sp. UIC 10036 TaxID=2304196 RepID=UPI0012DAC849|nr:tetratricopeptide repeat protein [Scytonema sp. UIC 10036]MUH01318.1 tetratricopeptide repeat protein [Scytonema sp. UIC 10036]